MTKCQEMALSVLTELQSKSRNEVLTRLLTEANNNDSEFRDILQTVSEIFNKALQTPGSVDNRDNEDNSTIERRFWVIFFQSLGYAAHKHNAVYEKIKSRDLSDYQRIIDQAIGHAEALSESLGLIQQYRNKGGIEYFSGDLDPIEWILEAARDQEKTFDNPALDHLSSVQNQLETIQHRYDNRRYWPEPESVIESLAKLLYYSQFRLEDHNQQRRKKVPGVLQTLIEEFHWNAEDSHSYHLPRGFINQLSHQQIASLISFAWGLDRGYWVNKSTIQKALSELT